jgi:DNA-binding GntR family transcriptional regulator
MPGQGSIQSGQPWRVLCPARAPDMQRGIQATQTETGASALISTTERTDIIARRYLHDEAADGLRELILSGELEPRARINEMALCARFGISRTPLREAIKLLAAEGLLELLPNRGARVAAISDVEIDEIIEVVAALEGAAGELACHHITPRELAALTMLTKDMMEAWRQKDYQRYFLRNQEIHSGIMAAARNQSLQTIYGSLSGRVQWARFSANKTPPRWSQAIQDHERMLELLANRESVALGQLLRDHLRSKKAIIAAAYSEEQAAVA